MESNLPLLVLDPLNFVPRARTPWAGARIPALKAFGLGLARSSLPSHVGESWEVSTDALFPSHVANLQGARLADVLLAHGEFYLGAETLRRYDKGHCPLLLKWLHAAEVLSVQLHPRNGNPLLGPSECGKPESWLVLEAEPGGHVWLGLREGITEREARAAFSGGDPASVLFRYEPRPGEILSIPPGLVHAVGPGLLLAEPQFVLPGKSGKTWRLSDWNRRYDDAGRQSNAGSARELHVEEAFPSIDWSLPRGTAGLSRLVIPASEDPFLGNAVNPFATHAFTRPGMHRYAGSRVGGFSLATCWAGRARLAARVGGPEVVLAAGASVFVAAGAGDVDVLLEPSASHAPDSDRQSGIAFFALASEHLDGLSQ